MCLISIIIPANERAETIERAITSVLNQGVGSFEIIVTLRNGDERSRRVMENSALVNNDKIKFIYVDKDMNGTDDWNDGFEFASGEYLLVLEGDDYLFPGCLLNFFEKVDQFEDLGMYVIKSDKYTFSKDGYLTNKEYLKYYKRLIEVPPPSQTIFKNEGLFYNTLDYNYAPEIEFYYRLLINSNFSVFFDNKAMVYREPSTDIFKGQKWKHTRDQYYFIKANVEDYSLSGLILTLLGLKLRNIKKLLACFKNNFTVERKLFVETITCMVDIKIIFKWLF
ncbi:glycosyltransferase [Vibrio sp. D404a]|uniref:glycosyltransferase n=1 Tax=unclassified Vibrio TaxID=2614977 RepID=UPI002553D541|nr:MULTISPECIES: glycosyltransferase [unclassified Vibrio]MDK9737705.1 glycosyltransferase [Vibrio sp. D404a]MDK9795307.1 glycosyltransferase [Vibrio sp. D449a]